MKTKAKMAVLLVPSVKRSNQRITFPYHSKILYVYIRIMDEHFLFIHTYGKFSPVIRPRYRRAPLRVARMIALIELGIDKSSTRERRIESRKFPNFARFRYSHRTFCTA